MDSVEWQKIWSKKYSLRLGENWTYSVATRFKELFGIDFASQRIIIKDGFGYGYFSKNKHEEVLEYIRKRILNEGFETYFEDRAKKILVDFFNYSKSIGLNDLNNKTLDDLRDIHNTYIAKEDEWMNYVWMIFLLDECFSKMLHEEVNKRYKEKTEDVLIAILNPEQKTAAMQEKLDMLELVRKVKGGLSDLSKENELQQITEKYSYFSILNMDEDLLGKDYFSKKLEEMNLKFSDPANELQNEIFKDKKLNQIYEQILKENEHDQKFINLIVASKKVSFYREYRNDLRQESYSYVRNLYIEIARRLNISIGEVVYMTRIEIQDSLSDGKLSLSIKDIKLRKNRSAIISLNKNVLYEFSPEKVNILFKECEHEQNSEIEKLRIRGVPIYKGKIKGIVKKIFNMNEDAGKFNNGDILVATTTNLAFIPLMGKAGAIVTDEGGLLTHTAIVSRELRKPAIVGTKYATKLLNNGDLVEVDAENGIVTKL